MKHSVYKRSEETHTVELTADDVLAALKMAGYVPPEVDRFDGLDVGASDNDGGLEITWRIVSQSTT